MCRIGIQKISYDANYSVPNIPALPVPQPIPLPNENKQKDTKIETLDSKGLNMMANMERNVSQIEYNKETGAILSIPTMLPDVGYGHDVNQRPLTTVPNSLSAIEALELLKQDIAYEEGIIASFDTNFTQDQFNALVSLRYNVGALGNISGLVEYLNEGSYERNELKNLIIFHYDTIITKNPKNEQYRVGWYNRTEKFLDIFFDGNYGDMPIDAVNGKVILK